MPDTRCLGTERAPSSAPHDPECVQGGARRTGYHWTRVAIGQERETLRGASSIGERKEAREEKIDNPVR